jgi:hypothetical protein
VWLKRPSFSPSGLYTCTATSLRRLLIERNGIVLSATIQSVHSTKHDIAYAEMCNGAFLAIFQKHARSSHRPSSTCLLCTAFTNRSSQLLRLPNTGERHLSRALDVLVDVMVAYCPSLRLTMTSCLMQVGRNYLQRAKVGLC